MSVRWRLSILLLQYKCIKSSNNMSNWICEGDTHDDNAEHYRYSHGSINIPENRILQNSPGLDAYGCYLLLRVSYFPINDYRLWKTISDFKYRLSTLIVKFKIDCQYWKPIWNRYLYVENRFYISKSVFKLTIVFLVDNRFFSWQSVLQIVQ